MGRQCISHVRIRVTDPVRQLFDLDIYSVDIRDPKWQNNVVTFHNFTIDDINAYTKMINDHPYVLLSQSFKIYMPKEYEHEASLSAYRNTLNEVASIVLRRFLGPTFDVSMI